MQGTEPMKYREEGKINKLWHLALSNRYNYKKELTAYTLKSWEEAWEKLKTFTVEQTALKNASILRGIAES